MPEITIYTAEEMEALIEQEYEQFKLDKIRHDKLQVRPGQRFVPYKEIFAFYEDILKEVFKKYPRLFVCKGVTDYLDSYALVLDFLYQEKVKGATMKYIKTGNNKYMVLYEGEELPDKKKFIEFLKNDKITLGKG